MARRPKFAGRNSVNPLTVVCTAILLALPATAARAQTSGTTPNQDQGQAAQSATQSNSRPNLAGTWKLNKDQSDDPRQKMADAMGRPSSQGAQNGEGRPQRPGAGRPGRGAGPRGGMMAEWSQLTIEQTDANIKVTGASGRVLATNEPETKTQSGDDGGMRFPPATAEWQGNHMIAKSQGFGGGSVRRTFELSPDGKQLTVTSKIENERLSQPVAYKLVYDRGKPETSAE